VSDAHASPFWLHHDEAPQRPAEQSPEQQSAALKFAQCIRENGVKDFPDPVNGQPLVDTTKIPSASEPGGKAILRAAMQKCRDALTAAVGGQ